MDSDRFSALFNFLSAHPRRVAASVVALVLCAAVGLFFIPFHHSMEVMLPTASDARMAADYLQSLDFSAKVAIAFSQSGEDVERTELFATADRFAASLEPPLMTQVLSTVDEQQMIRDIGTFLERAPELLGKTDLERLEKQSTREGVARILRTKYVQLLKPEGSFMSAMVQRDPFDIQMALIEKIRALSSSFGYDMRMENNHLVSADGRQVLLVLETDVPFTDAGGSRALVDYLHRQLETLPPSINAEMVCGHLHTISNEKVIRRDVGLTVSLASIAFVLLFLFFFRDPRANLIFIIPFAALLVGVNLAALVLGTLSPMMLGFGSVVGGVAVDYGIHVYIAVRRSASALSAVCSVARPVLLGALTTAGVFAAFFFSSIPGYIQLALFAIFSVLFSVAGALFVLPVFLVPKGDTGTSPPLRKMPVRRAWIILAVFALLGAAAIPFALKARFDSDIMRLDGTEKAILETEERFRETWGAGGAGQAVAAVSSPDPETALALNDQLYDALVEQVGADKVASLSPIWKSYASRKANSDRWAVFWSGERVADLKNLFHEEGEKYGFAPDAFDPFFQSLPVLIEIEGHVPVVQESEPVDNLIFDQLKSRFVVTLENETRIFTFIPDEPEMIKLLTGLKKSIPGLVLISRSAIASSLAQEYAREFTRIALIALGLVLLMAGLLLKSVRKVLIVLTPAFAGVSSVAVLARGVGTDLNVMNLVSGIIVIGLCVDYGIFHVHAYTHGLNLGTRTAISLSAGTTLIGAGALLFTLHPALFSVGLTLVGGISAGYATSMLVVPALCSLFLEEEKVCSPPFRRNSEKKVLCTQPKGGTTNLFFSLLFLLLTGCATVPFEPEPKADFRGVEPTAVIEAFDAAVGQHFELLQSVVFSYFGKGFTGLGYLSVDPDSDTYALSCMTPAGISLFELKGAGDDVDAFFLPPQLEKHGDRIAESMGRDLRRIYFGWSPSEGAEVKHKKPKLVFKSKQNDETVEYIFSGSRRLLTEKRFSKGWKTRCVVHYYDYEDIDGKLYPKGIILYNKQFHYRMVLRLKMLYPMQDDG